MAEYSKVNVKLSDSQLNRLKNAVKNQTGVTWNVWGKRFTSWTIIDSKTKN